MNPVAVSADSEDRTFVDAPVRGDRKKNPTVKRFVSLTAEEMKGLEPGDHIYYMDLAGRMAYVKVNGKVKRWKRDPERFEVPLKWGMYECWRESVVGWCFREWFGDPE